MSDIKAFAWLAGFLEADGSFTLNNRRKARITASQVQRWPLEECRRLFGGSICTTQPNSTSKPNSQPLSHWTVCGQMAASLMMTLFSFFSPKRKEQIKRALTVWRSRPPARGRRTQCPSGHLYSGRNLIVVTKRGGGLKRACRDCRNRHRRTRWARRRAEALA